MKQVPAVGEELKLDLQLEAARAGAVTTEGADLRMRRELE